MADDLLDQLVRPENLVDYQIDREVKFSAEHHRRLAAVEQAINPEVAPVADAASDPIVLSLQPTERSEIVDLVCTSDQGFNKVITVFAALCEEAHFLKQTAENKFYAPLSMFGHSKHDDATEYSEAVLEAMMGRALPLFQDCANFCNRCNAVAGNIVLQIASLYSKDSQFFNSWRDVHLRPVILALGDLLGVLVTIDGITRGNTLIGEAWEKYKRLADVMRSDPAKYGTDAASAAAFDKLLTELEKSVVTANAFRACLDHPYEPMPRDRGGFFYDSMRDRVVENVESLVGQLNTDVETNEATQIVGQYAVYALYRQLTLRFAPDKKAFEKLWRFQEKLPFVVLYSKYVWTIDAFMMRYCPITDMDYRKLIPKNPQAVRESAAEAVIEGFPAGVRVITSRVSAWLVRAQMAFSDAPLAGSHPQAAMDVLRARVVLVNQAVCLAHTASRLLHSFLNYHIHFSKAFKKRSIEPLARLLETIKVIEATVKAYTGTIGETVFHVQRDNVRAMADAYLPLRLKATTTKRDESQLPIAASTELIQALCVGSETWNPVRRILLELGLSIGLQKSGLTSEKHIAEISRAVWQLAMVAEFQANIRRACDVGIIYWARDLVGALIATACTVEGAGDIDCRHGSRLQYLCAALSDPARTLVHCVHVPNPPPPATRLAVASGSTMAKPPVNPESAFSSIEHPLTAYEAYVHGIIAHDIIIPLCRSVENDLRVQVHAIHLAHMEPPSIRTGKPPLVHLLSLTPIRFAGALVDIRQEVTHYLEKTFYELTTVALHDWKTYGEMASVAADKYGLALTDSHLPMGCLDQGLDVLQIMRNIHVFVARYHYNLNQQFFVERKGLKGSKHLNTVSITSISGSIRQHGTGMMNTTVNFAYQYLAQKFYVFSQFLFDEYIKSYLAKERRFYRRARKELDNRYPVGHAVELNKDIRKLGVTEDKQSFLDKFRQLVSEIGNALGYVRMVRSAGMHAASEAVKFVPDLTSVISFEESARQVLLKHPEVAEGELPPVVTGNEGLSPETIAAAKTLDDVVKNLMGSFAEGVDYFKLLVSVFQHVLLGASIKHDNAGANDKQARKDKDDNHLRNFFLLMPALTVNFLEHLHAAKDRTEKAVKGADSFFTDDGFAIGVAYVLAILKQDRSFDSLHWWDSVRRHHQQELNRYKAEIGGLGKSKADQDRLDELQFKTKRVHIMQKEYDALFYTFNGARTFFKQETDDEDEVAHQV